MSEMLCSGMKLKSGEISMNGAKLIIEDLTKIVTNNLPTSTSMRIAVIKDADDEDAAVLIFTFFDSEGNQVSARKIMEKNDEERNER